MTTQKPMPPAPAAVTVEQLHQQIKEAASACQYQCGVGAFSRMKVQICAEKELEKRGIRLENPRYPYGDVMDATLHEVIRLQNLHTPKTIAEKMQNCFD